ncbi:hypothetical protein SRABI83_02939 [Arthrobacter sp. Bi83]|nr:hypothetical protein SRABI83_02939 [Arthrobacter sp. Bi83]
MAVRVSVVLDVAGNVCRWRDLYSYSGTRGIAVIFSNPGHREFSGRLVIHLRQAGSISRA